MPRFATASAFGSAAFAVVGLAVPIAFPDVEPWYGHGLLLVALILLVVGLTLFATELTADHRDTARGSTVMHNPTINIYNDPVRAEVASVADRAVQASGELPSVTVSPPKAHAVLQPDSSRQAQVATSLAPVALDARGHLFPQGLYVGAVTVSLARLADEGLLEIAARAFNGTDVAMKIDGVMGQIKWGSGPFKGKQIPSPTFKNNGNVISPFTEFVIVLQQPIPGDIAAEFLRLVNDDHVSLDLRHLNIMIATEKVPENKARLPLWDGVNILRQNEVVTRRGYIMTAVGAVIGVATASGGRPSRGQESRR